MNYKHLHYFWTVAKTGSIAAASQALHLAPHTVSGQVQLLEAQLGSELFARRGRTLELTDAGRLALEYAEDIFSLGSQLEQALRDYPRSGRTIEFRVGVSDALPKPIAHRLLTPALEAGERVHLVCREWKLDSLLAELATHRLDLVLTDAPIAPSTSIRAFNHRLGEAAVAFFAVPALARRLGDGFPASLESAPLLLPGEDSAVRARLLRWIERRRLRPQVAGEFDDSALMQAFAQAGKGVAVAPALLADELARRHGLELVGVADEVVQEFFAVSIERRLTHPCVLALREAARAELGRAGAGAALNRPATPRRTRRPHAADAGAASRAPRRG